MATSADRAETRWEACGRSLLAGPVPRVMGILNVTPDSFSDGGRAVDLEGAITLASELEAEGADLIDIGGESSRPGSEPVALAEELRRVIPVIELVAGRTRLPISVDTTKAEVARQALRAGAVVVNDITALRGDPELAAVVAEAGAGIVLMHMTGTPRTMQDDPRYENVLVEVYDELARRVEWAEARGIPRIQIAVDPGIGFGKTAEHNLELLRNLGRFATLGCAVLVGLSRKAFLGALTGRPVSGRVAASVAASLAAARRGAKVVRVHDVGPMVDAIKVWTALEGWDDAP